MKKLLSVIILSMLSTAMILLPTGCSRNEETKGDDPVINIGIIQLAEHEALDASREGFIAALADNGYKDGENITIDVQNAQGDPPNLSPISERFVKNKVDLILAIATDSAQSIAGMTTEIPILGTAITDYETARLVESNERPGGNVSGTTDMNPIEEQIDLLVKLVPDVETVGVLYNSSEDNSVVQAEIAKEIIEKRGLKYTEVTISSSNEVQQAAQSIVKECDAIYVPTDNTLAASMPVVYGVIIQSKTPVICGESGMVKSGGLATLGINYYNLGYQTGLMAVRILKDGADPATMPIESQDEFDFTINGTVAREIGLEIPDDLQEYVEEYQIAE